LKATAEISDKDCEIERLRNEVAAITAAADAKGRREEWELHMQNVAGKCGGR
jgi:hypothetical protein